MEKAQEMAKEEAKTQQKSRKRNVEETGNRKNRREDI